MIIEFQKIKFRKLESWKNHFENGILENSNFEELFENRNLFWKIIWKRKFWKLKFWKLNFEELFENGIFFKKKLKFFKRLNFKMGILEKWTLI